jgi:protein-L-isoaspartate(D-aspartate) O-methyltransferase
MNLEIARRHMVEQQIRVWDVSDEAVLATMLSVAREYFVPAGFEHLAYADTEIPLGHGQAMLKPNIDGRVLQALNLNDQQSVLEIGTGSGYLTACLAALAGSVTSIDCFQDFVDLAGIKLADIGVNNVRIECMDAIDQLPDGQFDAIAVTGAIPRPDRRLLESLKPGGRMFLFVGESPVVTAELVTTGDGVEWRTTSLFETDIAALQHTVPTPEFSF